MGEEEYCDTPSEVLNIVWASASSGTASGSRSTGAQEPGEDVWEVGAGWDFGVQRLIGAAHVHA